MVGEEDGMYVHAYNICSAPASDVVIVIKQSATRKAEKSDDRQQELDNYIAALERGEASPQLLQELARFCVEAHVLESIVHSADASAMSSPSPMTQKSSSSSGDIWDKDKNFSRLWKALLKFLELTLVHCLHSY